MNGQNENSAELLRRLATDSFAMNWNKFDTRWNIFDFLVARCFWLQTKSKNVQGNSMTLAAEKTWRLLLAKAGRPATDSECAKLLSLFELFLQIAEIQKRSTNVNLIVAQWTLAALGCYNRPTQNVEQKSLLCGEALIREMAAQSVLSKYFFLPWNYRETGVNDHFLAWTA